MPSAILELYSSVGTLTETLGSLASSTSGVGRQSTLVDNSTTRYARVLISASITLGTSPTANTAIYFYLIRDDGAGTPIRTDGAGTTDAAWTRKSADLIGVFPTGGAPSTGDVLKGSFYFDTPGGSWGIGVVNASGVALNSTNGNHVLNWKGVSLEAQ